MQDCTGLQKLKHQNSARTRFSCVEELLTNPSVSVQTTKSIAGHVSQRMVDRYAHIRLEAKRSALEALTDNGGNRGNPAPEMHVSPNGLLHDTGVTERLPSK